jgi:hypothetical protein
MARLIALLPLALVVAPLAAAPLPYGGLRVERSYVALADMALSAKAVVAATILQAIPLKGEAAAGVAAGRTRYYVQARVEALISGDVALPPNVSYLVDLPDDIDGRRAKLKQVPVLLLAASVAPSGELRLVAPEAQVPRTPENEKRLRAILTAAVAPDAPPAITGISRAFHVAGSLPGESETQIFLRTADARPISLNILRRPHEEPRWAVALSELVDASAAPPQRDSLLWYRLACGLPAKLPDGTVATLSADDADGARADYDVVLKALGPCTR